MEKKIVIFALFLLPILFYTHSTKSENTIAIVTGCEGTVVIHNLSTNQTDTASLGYELTEKSIISVKGEGKSIIYFYDGNLVSLYQNQSLKLGTDFESSEVVNIETNLKGRKESFKFWNSGLALSSNQDRERALFTPGILKEIDDSDTTEYLTPILPANKLLGNEISFAWNSEKYGGDFRYESKDYTTLIYDTKGNVIFSKTFAWKSGVSKLIPSVKIDNNLITEGGTFYYTVYPTVQTPPIFDSLKTFTGVIEVGNKKNASKPYSTLKAKFEIPAKEVIDKINFELKRIHYMYVDGVADLNTVNLLSVLYLKKEGFYLDAIHFLDKVIGDPNTAPDNLIKEKAVLLKLAGGKAAEPIISVLSYYLR